MLGWWVLGAWARSPPPPTPWVPVAVTEVVSDVPRGDPAALRATVRTALLDDGKRILEGADLALEAHVDEEVWLFRQGLLQVEINVRWALRDPSLVDPVYQGQTRGTVTRRVERRGKTRRARRRDDLGDLPQAAAMWGEALTSATRSLSDRRNFRAALFPSDPTGVGGATTPTLDLVIDHSDSSRLGTAPPALRDRVALSGIRRRDAGIAMTVAGFVVAITSFGTYFVAPHVPRAKLDGLRVAELTGWAMMGGGGVLWYHGDKRSRAW